MRFEWLPKGSFMPKISSLGQKLWPTGRGRTDRQTDTQTDRQTEKVNTEDPLFRKNIFFDFLFFL